MSERSTMVHKPASWSDDNIIVSRLEETRYIPHRLFFFIFFC